MKLDFLLLQNLRLSPTNLRNATVFSRTLKRKNKHFLFELSFDDSRIVKRSILSLVHFSCASSRLLSSDTIIFHLVTFSKVYFQCVVWFQYHDLRTQRYCILLKPIDYYLLEFLSREGTIKSPHLNNT